MDVFKFTKAGGRAPFTGFAWPLPRDGRPGEWVVAPVDPCRTGIHAAKPEHLPFWIADELWELELDGEVIETPYKVVGGRGRLVRKVEAWSPEGRLAFARDCVERVRSLAAGRLDDYGRPDLADRLRAPGDLAALEHVAGAVGRELDGLAGLAAGYVADVAREALAGRLGNCAHDAAIAAGDLNDGAGRQDLESAGYLDERARQARWLREQLALA